MRSVVAFEWTEIAPGDDGRGTLGLPDFAGAVPLPVVELPDGTRLFAPGLREIADRLGWVAQPRLRECDLSIYGAGPAGLRAAVYAASEGPRVVLVERHAVGRRAGRRELADRELRGLPARRRRSSPSTARLPSSRPASPARSRRATCDTTRSSGWPRLSARAPWP